MPDGPPPGHSDDEEEDSDGSPGFGKDPEGVSTEEDEDDLLATPDEEFGVEEDGKADEVQNMSDHVGNDDDAASSSRDGSEGNRKQRENSPRPCFLIPSQARSGLTRLFSPRTCPGSSSSLSPH